MQCSPSAAQAWSCYHGEITVQVSLCLIQPMPSSDQRTIFLLVANGWKQSGFPWGFVSLKIWSHLRKGRPQGQLHCISRAPWRSMFWFAEDVGRKARDQGLCWLLGLGKALAKPQSPSGPGRGEEVVIRIRSVAVEVCRTHTQWKTLMPTAELRGDVYQWADTLSAVLFTSRTNLYHCLVLFQHHNHNRHTRHR